MIRKNLTKQMSSWENWDRDISFGIWYIEKEFHVGMIDDTFPVAKFWHLYDEYNMKTYNKMNNPKGGSGRNAKTFK